MEYVFLGNHPSMKKIRDLIAMVAETAFSVLITGETGTGKEVVARLLHDASGRRNNAFIKINCAALPLNLLESELFGYEKGAFTGADKSKPGKFELASDGAIFLDEIGDMPMSLQSKLLQVLQNGEFTRLGGISDIKVDAWVIAATNHNLEKDMHAGSFREDLYYRLNVIKIEIPPLRERRQDIGLLTRYYVKKHGLDYGIDVSFALDGDIRKLFQIYHWPGNVRELSSTVLRLMVGDEPALVKMELIDSMDADGIPVPEDMREEMAEAGSKEVGEAKTERSTLSLKKLTAEASVYIEKRAIRHALNMTGGNKVQTAKMLKISYKTLFNKMDRLGLKKK
ncbi:MAG: sigma-54 dependent transcriptional regulator [Desulfatiglandaceae bacterium]|jgi:two-component system, NtrC family, response regulator AtoC